MRMGPISKVSMLYDYDTRLNQLPDGFWNNEGFQEYLSAFFIEMEHYHKGKDFIYTPENFWNSIKEEFIETFCRVKNQPGYAISLFFYLEDFWTGLSKNSQKPFPKMNVCDFLSMENQLLIPMRLIRPNEKYLEDVSSQRYISCIYIVDYKDDLLVSPFCEQEVAKIWFNRIKHSSLADWNNVFSAGVMYFCAKSKKLLYANNASGHYRLKDMHTTQNIKKPLQNLSIDYSQCLYSNYDDVEFQNGLKL